MNRPGNFEDPGAPGVAYDAARTRRARLSAKIRDGARVIGVLGALFWVLTQGLAGCSTEYCGKCDSAGELEFCVDCSTIDECTHTISDKSTGEVKFTCTAKNGEPCATNALLEYCDARH